MAAAFAPAAGGDWVRVESAGSEPAQTVHGVVAEVMAERGIDISDAVPTRLSIEMLESADAVVTMGCVDACPVVLGRRYIDWALDDPAGRPVSEVRAIRDEIESLVKDLIRELGVGPEQTPETPTDGQSFERAVTS